ncbi:MAG: hypothetical protein HY350_03280 [Candidatus Omnitrophica bacterium]|nr:hypothetical protein [Candidatus Omnitrophota bacterium]
MVYPFIRIVKKNLGEILLEKNIITTEQLSQVLEEQKKQGGLIGQHLVRMGYAKEEDIIGCLVIQYGFPYLPIANYEIDRGSIEKVPEEFARKYCLIPIDNISNVLTVVMSNPLDTAATSELEALTGCKVQVFIGTTTEITEAIDKYYEKKK